MSANRQSKIILGAGVPDLEELLRTTKQVNHWTPETEQEYWERVRTKAQAGAKDILTRALAEGEKIKAKAHEEGLDNGLREAQGHLDNAMNEMADRLARTMNAVNAAGPQVAQRYRDDLAILTRLCVEKVLKVELPRSREASVARLLDQALELIEAQREYTVKVHPEDEELTTELLERAKARHPQLKAWRVRATPGMEPGGVIVESEEGMADNSVETRRAAVSALLDQLSLSEEE